jgi:hypothetical protein
VSGVEFDVEVVVVVVVEVALEPWEVDTTVTAPRPQILLATSSTCRSEVTMACCSV